MRWNLQQLRPHAVLTGILSLVVSAALVTGCGNKAANEEKGKSVQGAGAELKVKKRTIGYLDIFAAGAYQKRVHDAFKLAVKPTGWDVKFIDAGGDPQKAQQGMQSLVNQKVDAIIDSAADPELVRPALLAAQRAKIPVITVAGQNRPGSGLSVLLAGEYGENEADLAKPMAEQITKDLPRGSKIAILKTDLLFAAIPRARVIDKAAKDAGLKVVANVETPFDYNAARKKALDILTANKDLDAIVSVFDVWAAAAVDAIKSSGRADKVKLYSFYYDSINGPLMAANKFFVAVTDGNQAEGSAIAVDQLLKHFEKKQPIDHNAADGVFKYAALSRGSLPPKGQDGPIPLEEMVAPYVERWKQEYAK